MSTVSILIPTYNRESLIRNTIQCAIDQTFRDIEIIIVDNCSTDATCQVALEMAQTDNRIRLFRNEGNVGPVLNWLACARQATSPYSKILFSDDLIAKDYLELTLPHIVANDCALVYTPAVIGSEEWAGEIAYNAFHSNTKISTQTFIRLAMYCGDTIPVSPGAALFRTSDLLANIRTELPGITDYDFKATGAGVDWLTYMLTALKYPYVQYVNKPMCFFRAHGGSLTIKNESNLVTIGQVLAKRWLGASLKM
jgi:glycosyltransferase involved in cell wall biosynthesis